MSDLIDAAGLSSDDRVIAVGDLVDRGPDAPRVLEFFRSTRNARAIMGNHERKHVRSLRREIRPALSQTITRRQFGEDRYPEAVAFMDALPRFLELPKAVVVHAFFEPGVALREQKEAVIVGTMSGEAYLTRTYARPWYELYDGDRPIIVGHHNYLGTGQPFIYRNRVFGLDTGYCFGGRLTGLILPEFRLISVRARRNHRSVVKSKAQAIGLSNLEY
jgi:serine/threonine protein phosphatase 1